MTLHCNVVFCEGGKDTAFLHETMTSILKIDSNCVKPYETIRSLVTDIRSGRQTWLSLVNSGGYPTCVKIAVRFCRQLWYEKTLKTIGILSDSDIGDVYRKTTQYLDEFLRSECKEHNVIPKVTKLESEKKIIIDFGKGRVITIWTLQVPQTLEHHVSKVLKSDYPQLQKYRGENSVILAACRELGCSARDIIRSSVSKFINKRWFKTLCKNLTANLSSP